MDVALSLLVVVLTLAVTGLHAHHSVSQARTQAQRLRKRWQEQRERLRKGARTTLALKREIAHIRLTADALEEECQRLEAEIRRHAHPENRIFVLEERRTPGDSAWIAQIAWRAEMAGTAAAAGPRWRQRRVMAWAPDEATARGRLLRRFPLNDGYSIETVSPRTATPA